MQKDRLIGKTLAELKTLVAELGLPAFSAKQIADWIYVKKISEVGEMTNISVSNREKIASRCVVGKEAPVESYSSTDGTKKYLFKVKDSFIETVYIPEGDRATLCVSSQLGCKMNCLFCMTGKQGFGGNLTSADIINQIQAIPEVESITNIVYMGMGEPMDNIDEVLKTLDILTASYGYGWSPKRITVSTVGYIPGLKRFLSESDCHLAVSLHNPIPEERYALMPMQKAFPIENVLELIKQYDFSHQRRVSFEYTMFAGVNDSPIHARRISSLLKGLDCRINLIRFHSIPGVDLKGTSQEGMEKFRDMLTKYGFITTIRKSRGEDILAACGLLSSLNKNK